MTGALSWAGSTGETHEVQPTGRPAASTFGVLKTMYLSNAGGTAPPETATMPVGQTTFTKTLGASLNNGNDLAVPLT